MSLAVLRAQRPLLINILLAVLCLWILTGLYGFVIDIMRALQRGFLPLSYIIVLRLTTVNSVGVNLVCLFGLLNRRSWSWWMTGILAASGVIGFFLFLIQINQISSAMGQGQVEISPGYLEMLIRLVINIACLFIIFRPEVRAYLGIHRVSMTKSLGIIFALGFLFVAVSMLVIFSVLWLVQ